MFFENNVTSFLKNNQFDIYSTRIKMKKKLPAYFKTTPLFIFFLILQLFFSVVYCQYIINGKVIDKKTKEPLEFAVVSIVRNSKNTLTDKDGVFVLKNIRATDSIIISFIGYNSLKLKTVSSGKRLTIELEKGKFDLKTVVITSYSNNLVLSRTLSNLDLNMQPVKSAQDLLRLIPGLFIAQHQGGGKAEQIFLRGFDADHGTDVNVSVDGMPVNMVSHAHGQGYADLHFLIPETLAGYDFGKGPYYTNKGDLNTAGYVAYNTINVPDKNVIKIEGGEFNTGRIVSIINLLSEKEKLKGQSAYIAGEALYSDGGPFALPEHFNRYNLFGKFNSILTNKSKLNLTISTLSSGWRSSGEIPNRAIDEGYIKNRFGVIDSSQGGYTSRTNVNIRVTTQIKNNLEWENQVFFTHYYFNLISNFTYNYYFPVTGDEFRQFEIRDMGGFNGKLSKKTNVGNTSFTTVIGEGLRADHISPSELDHTENAKFLEHLQYGKTKELNANAYADETIRNGNWLLNAGIRFDYFHFYYSNLSTDSFATNIYNGLSPYAQKAIVSPKLNIEYTFNTRFQLYFKSGKGFHSNDARVVIANKGYEILPAAWGADIGTNWKPFPGLFMNAAIWYLYLQQEFVFGQDLINQPGGPVQPNGKTSRIGIDLSARYQLTNWLFASMNLNLARPRFIDSSAGHNHLPLAPGFTSTAGLDFKFKNGINGGISYRYLHNRAANSTYSLTALGYWVTDFALNYTKKKYEVGVQIENLLNISWNESQFEYVSRLKNETMPVDDVSFTPGVPFFAKLKLAVFF